ncbi:ARP2/3 complex subunit, putative [Trypanosoma equiperdum]|uniref:Actin-related protein 2/3 complex subunit 4 n=4 Tax=Trypanozoon TaxID=39700 RepID=Q587H0_TRYB2|nr:ARP2/3 complex subunit, putative [Trypanosoma brucei brucei TREU927]AAX78894.1 ARP2/3 complex subunit, putative [Trypanosoma brucei]RHW74006.1 ARP2/3 complex subunit [Trypanosoma brucei equiperdum]SCU64803.1 ARP2/3 complex subunit, putative [Trypanosoma equiperdum]AAQ15747.1 ARP2/3 complex subunit, putative [Trypanosoma brucei brucei TREU927]ABF58734.1 ARPC4 [Trypanosoma brucei]
MSEEELLYYTCIKNTLHAALCIGNYPSRTVERHNKPEVEVSGCAEGDNEGKSPELLLNRLHISRSEQERCLIEASINSVRISFAFPKMDPLAELIARKYVSFLAQRGQQFRILRKKPIAGYDISFLITHEEVEVIPRSKIIEFVITFLMEMDKDITLLKINANERARRAARQFFQALSTN